MYQKGERFKARHDKEVYEVVGRWSGSVVLAPESAERMEVLIYTETELDELLEKSALKRIMGPEMLMG